MRQSGTRETFTWRPSGESRNPLWFVELARSKLIPGFAGMTTLLR
jgi:hypothetical protein